MSKPPTALTTAAKSDADFLKSGQVRLLQWVVFLRVVVAFFILGTTFILYNSETLLALYSLIAVNVLITLLSAIFIERRAESRRFALFHIYLDFLFVSALLFVTGLFYSPFNFLYVLTIIFSALLTNRILTIFNSLLAALFYNSLILLQYFNLLFPLDLEIGTTTPPTIDQVSMKILPSSLAFITLGFLASYLSQRSQMAMKQIARQQQEMAALKVLNENIVQSLPLGLVTCDKDDVIIFANRFVNQVIDPPDPKIIGRPLSQLLPGLHFNPFIEKSGDLEITDRAGKKRTILAGVSDLRDENEEIIGRIVTLQDITIIRELENAAKQADRHAAIGKLAAGIAHEIRNPLASMSGSIQLLKSELQLDSSQEQLMKIVLRETDRLNTLIGDFLIYARPSAQQATEADLNELLDEQLRVLHHDPACEGIEIRPQFAGKLICRFDAMQLRQVFWNLFLNAIQAMAGSPGTLTVWSGLSPKRPGYLEVVVSDTGPGIPLEIRDAIFDPFFTTKAKGTGLGLTVSYRIVESHNGLMWVDSPPGQGASFHVLLPTG